MNSTLSLRQIKALISWAKSQHILTIEVSGMKVVFNPTALAQQQMQSVPMDLTKVFDNQKSREALLKEEDDLLFASAI